MTELPVADSFLLPEKQADDIFKKDIVRTLLVGAERQGQPIAIVLSAPPGAGKSVLARDIREGFPDGSKPVIVDVDSFRPFYPGYSGLQQKYGWAADDLVQVDARRWLDQSLKYLAEHGANVIVEHGLRDREATEALLAHFAADPARNLPGHRIEAALLGPSAAESRLGMLERYQSSFERVGLGRYVSEELHDARYRHLADVADWIDADPRFAAAAVYRRGSAEPVFRKERGSDGQWPSTEGLRDALEKQRERPYSLEDSRAFIRLHHSLSARMAPEWQESLGSARAAAEPLLHPAAEIPRNDKPAVTFGRYQIVSIAHLDTIRTILQDFPTVEIGVVDLETKLANHPVVPAHLQEFYRGCEANTSPGKNPMTAEERIGFWRATVEEAGLKDRVSVSIIPRPELDPEGFNQKYPEERFALVFPTASGEGFDLVRNASFEEILGRQVHPVDPPLEYHTSDIRAAYRAGNEAWRNGFAPGGLQAFIAADGPRRLLGEAPSPTPGEQAVQIAMHGVVKPGNRPPGPVRQPSAPPPSRRPDANGPNLGR